MGAVLIADDDSLVRLVLRRALERRGHCVLEAADASGLDRALADRPLDLCMLDASMPGSTLASRLEEVRRLHPKVPVVLLSGLAELPREAREAGLRFERKPLDLAVLDDLLSCAGLPTGAPA